MNFLHLRGVGCSLSLHPPLSPSHRNLQFWGRVGERYEGEGEGEGEREGGGRERWDCQIYP